MVETVDDFVQSITSEIKQNGKMTFDFHEKFNALSLQIICRTAMGYKLRYEDKTAQQYRQVI